MEPIKYIVHDSWNIIFQYVQVEDVCKISLTCKQISGMAQVSLKSLRNLYFSSLNAFYSLPGHFSIKCRCFELEILRKKIQHQNILIATESKESKLSLELWGSVNSFPIGKLMKKDPEFEIQEKRKIQKSFSAMFATLGSQQFILDVEVGEEFFAARFFNKSQNSFNRDVHCEYRAPILGIEVIFPIHSSMSFCKKDVITLAAKNGLKKLSIFKDILVDEENPDIPSSICTLW